MWIRIMQGQGVFISKKIQFSSWNHEFAIGQPNFYFSKQSKTSMFMFCRTSKFRIWASKPLMSSPALSANFSNASFNLYQLNTIIFKMRQLGDLHQPQTSWCVPTRGSANPNYSQPKDFVNPEFSLRRFVLTSLRKSILTCSFLVLSNSYLRPKGTQETVLLFISWLLAPSYQVPWIVENRWQQTVSATLMFLATLLQPSHVLYNDGSSWRHLTLHFFERYPGELHAIPYDLYSKNVMGRYRDQKNSRSGDTKI